MKIKAGDMVEVISGDDKGKQGKVLNFNPKTDRVVIEGLILLKGIRSPVNKINKVELLKERLITHFKYYASCLR